MGQACVAAVNRMADPLIEGRQIEKYYAQDGQTRIQVIAPTDISVYPDEILAVLGPSGSGKSTLLRMLTGLSTPSAGQVFWHGQPVTGPCENVSIVFQSFALFPWLTVLENVEAPLKARGVPADEREKRSMKMLDTVGLAGFESAYPKELSGGMKQRVGFARALVVEPEVLFMDEPFSALDVLTAENLRSELLDLWSDRKLPTRAVFIVTHNIEEAVLLADRIIVLGKNPGVIRTDFRVELPRPRDRKNFLFEQIVDHVYKVLTRPDAVPTLEAVASADTPGAPAAASKFQMLPHARPGGVSGLLEILYDSVKAGKSGREDIYRLAAELAFEVDEILPIVEAAALLGFLKVSEGDVEITPEGLAFVDADIVRQKELFRQSALDHAVLIRQITRSLEKKANHRLSDEFFHDILDEHFTEEETIRQLQTAIVWGRYAELFDHDAKAQQFFIPEPDEEEKQDGPPVDSEITTGSHS
jgi:NitT/TauT family transport system ATP-binding protein